MARKGARPGQQKLTPAMINQVLSQPLPGRYVEAAGKTTAQGTKSQQKKAAGGGTTLARPGVNKGALQRARNVPRRKITGPGQPPSTMPVNLTPEQRRKMKEQARTKLPMIPGRY